MMQRKISKKSRNPAKSDVEKLLKERDELMMRLTRHMVDIEEGKFKIKARS